MKRFFLAASAILLLAGCASTRPEKPSVPECIAFRIPANTRPEENSAFWRNVPEYALKPVPGYIFRNPVKIQFAYDRDNLYFRFDAKDDDLLDECPEKQKNGMFLFADALELFARTPESRGYWEFHFIPSGRCGAIHFPARGRRMPSNVRYLPMPGLKFQVKLNGTLNNMKDRDSGWIGLARIPLKGIGSRCTPFDPARGLLIQVTSIAYSVYADWDEKSQLNCIPGAPTDPHHLPAWVKLKFQP